VRVAVCLFFIANEGLSILENLGLMGVPLPPFLKNMLEAMRDKASSGEEKKA
jgi:phage-related holin